MRLQRHWIICLAAVLTAAQPASAAELERSEVHALVRLSAMGYKVVVPSRGDVPWRVTVTVGGPKAADTNMGRLYFVPNLEKLYLRGTRSSSPHRYPRGIGILREPWDENDPPRGAGYAGVFGPPSAIGRPPGEDEFGTEESIVYAGACPITDAGLAHLRALKKLKILDTGNARITETGLAHLRHITSLEELDLDGHPTAGAGLRHLNGLVNLRSLRVRGARGSGAITDVDLKHLENLTNLEMLTIDDGHAITDAGLEHLGKLTKLRELTLIGTKINGVGLKHLEPLVNLETLKLPLSPVTDLGLAELSALSRLENLDLHGTKTTDAGLAHLKRLTNLEKLDLRATQVTLGGLARHLSGMRSLKQIHAADPDSSKAEIKKLMQAFPDTWIGLYD